MKKKRLILPLTLLVLGVSQMVPSAANRGLQTIGLVEEAEAAESFETYLVGQLKNKRSKIDVSGYGIQKDKMMERFLEVLNRHPELFYVKKSLSMSFSTTTFEVNQITPAYLSYDLQDMEQVDKVVNQIVTLITDEMTDLEKVMRVHDYLCMTVEYAQEDLNNNQVSEEAHTLYGSLIQKKSVCDGYATAFMYILNQVGVETTMVEGKGDGIDHAWNQVKVNGKWYMVDVTWGDPVWDNYGNVRHTYFLKSESDFPNHVWDKSKFNRCTDTTFDQAFWNDVNTQFVPNGNDWYYIDEKGDLRKHSLDVSKVNQVGTKVASLGGKWYQFGSDSVFYTKNYAKLDTVNGQLFYSMPDGIYNIGFDGSGKSYYYKVDTSKGYVYGMKIQDDKILYQLSEKGFTKNRTVGSVSVQHELQNQKVTVGQSTYTKTYGDGRFSITAKTNGDGTLKYTSTNTKVVKVDSKGKVTIVGAGSAKIKITASATNNFRSASKYVSITVKPKALTGSIKISSGTYVYNGAAKRPSVQLGTLKKNTDFKVVYSNNTKVGKATISVIGIHNYKGTKKKTFNIVPAKSVISKLNSVNKGCIGVYWNIQPEVDRYEIYISRSKDFKSNVRKVIADKKGKILSSSFTGLASGKIYYVRMRGYKTVQGTRYTGAFSSVRSIRIQ